MDDPASLTARARMGMSASGCVEAALSCSAPWPSSRVPLNLRSRLAVVVRASAEPPARSAAFPSRAVADPLHPGGQACSSLGLLAGGHTLLLFPCATLVLLCGPTAPTMGSSTPPAHSPEVVGRLEPSRRHGSAPPTVEGADAAG